MANQSVIAGIHLDPAQVAEIEDLLKGLPVSVVQIVVGGINKTSRVAATFVRRRLAAETGLPVRMFGRKDSGMVRPLLANYEQGQAEGGIRILDYNIPLHKFGAKRTPLSLATTAAFSKSGDVETVPNFAFRRSLSKD